MKVNVRATQNTKWKALHTCATASLAESFAREPGAEQVDCDTQEAQEGSRESPTRLKCASMQQSKPSLGRHLHSVTLLATTLSG